MRFNNFFLKIFLGNLLVIGVIMAISGIIAYRQLNSEALSDKRARQDHLVSIAQKYFAEVLHRENPNMDRLCKDLIPNDTMRITLIAPDGEVLGDSVVKEVSKMENHKTPNRLEVIAALAGKTGMNVRQSQTLGIPYRYVARPIIVDGKVAGAVRIAMPMNSIAESQTFIRNTLLWAATAAAVVAVLLALLLSWTWYTPLKQISQSARRIATGDLSRKVHITGSDELSKLADALDTMRVSLAAQIEQIETQKDQLQAIVANLQDGVIALDPNASVVFMNASACKLMGVNADKAAGEHIQTIIRSSEVLDLYQQAMKSQEVAQKEIKADIASDGQTLDVSAIAIAGSEAQEVSSLLVIRDISDKARMVAMKAEFVANASHELRTPLATIRAAVDSLNAVDFADAETIAMVLPMLDRHVARLENMTNDLLDLNATEAGSSKLKTSDISLASLQSWGDEHFRQAAHTKGVNLEITTSDTQWTFTSDRNLVNLIMQNLLHNAIKFTPAGGMVKCSMDNDGEHFVFTVSDTGCGIPGDMQEKVFDRFFQVAHAKTGDSTIRGTGLGLAIVKHAAERLGADIELTSTPGKGTSIKVRIPSTL